MPANPNQTASNRGSNRPASGWEKLGQGPDPGAKMPILYCAIMWSEGADRGWVLTLGGELKEVTGLDMASGRYKFQSGDPNPSDLPLFRKLH